MYANIKTKKETFIAGLLLAVLLVLALLDIGLVFSAVSYRVNAGTDTDIDAHGVCKNVANGASYPDIFVPINTSTEWADFRSNYPTGITLSDCAECSTSPDCDGLYHSCFLNGNMMTCLSGYCCCETTQGPCGAECPPDCPV